MMAFPFNNAGHWFSVVVVLFWISTLEAVQRSALAQLVIAALNFQKSVSSSSYNFDSRIWNLMIEERRE